MSEHPSLGSVTQHTPTILPRIIYRSGEAHVPTSQCDCACAAAVGPARPALASFEPTIPYAPGPALLTHPLPPDYLAALSLRCMVILNSPAAQLLATFNGGRTPREVLQQLPSNWPAEPIHTTLQEMVGLGLLAPLGAEQQVLRESPTSLIAWLHVTDACNLRCVYCYVSKTDESISPETGREAIDAVFRSATRHDFQWIKLKYAGGEPSLCFDLVEQLHTYARTRAEALGLELEAVMLSNGVALSDRMLEALLTQDIRLSISLDSLDESHDAQRPLADGKGSAHLVCRTIERALKLGLYPDIAVTVTDRNLSTLPDTVAWLVEHDLPFNLNFYRENDNSASRTDLRLQDERLIAAMRRAFAVIEEQLPRRSLSGSLLDRAQFVAPHHYPCAAAHNYLVIDHHGHIVQCQMDMAHPITDIWADDPLAAVQSAPDGIPGLSVDEKEGCTDCPWRYWCAGGCPLQAHRANGRYDAPSPHCSVYRALLPDLIRLEGLRLLRHTT